MSSDRRMAGSDAEADKSEAEAAGGELVRPPEPLKPAAMPLSESALCPAAAAGVALGKGTVSDTRQLPDPVHAGSSLAALSRLQVHAVLCGHGTTDGFTTEAWGE